MAPQGSDSTILHLLVLGRLVIGREPRVHGGPQQAAVLSGRAVGGSPAWPGQLAGDLGEGVAAAGEDEGGGARRGGARGRGGGGGRGAAAVGRGAVVGGRGAVGFGAGGGGELDLAAPDEDAVLLGGGDGGDWLGSIHCVV